MVGALLGAAAWLQRVREQPYPAPLDQRGHRCTSRRARRVRYLSAGYQTLAADLYWIRAIQYYGDDASSRSNEQPADQARRCHGRNYALLYPLLDLTTTLDPRFNIAYRFGSIFLAEAPPGGPGRPDLAIALLEKGLRDRPDKWEYMQDIGFVHYWWTHDYQGRRGVVSEGERGSRRPLVPAVAGGHDAGRGRRSRVVAPDVGVDSAVGGNRLAPERSRAPAGCS